MSSSTLLPLCLAAALAGPALGQGAVCVFQGPGGGTGRVVSVDEQSGALLPAVPQLQAIQLVSFEAAHRCRLTELLPRTARRNLDAWNVAHLVLPGARGSLHHYRRSEGSLQVYGFFVVRPDGTAQVLHELPVAAGSPDPYLSKVAVDMDGSAFLVATRIGAGGDLLEVRLDGSVLNRTQSVPPLRIGLDSLHLGPGFGAAVSGRGFVRFNRAAGAQIELVPFSAGEQQPQYFDALASSLNGQWCVAIAGSDAQNAYPYVFGASGASQRANAAPSVFTGAGFMPQSPSGPYLAVSNDGTQAIWRTSVTTPTQTSGEAMLGFVAQPMQAEMLSSNARMLDTLDEVGLFGFRIDGTAIMAVGERTIGPAGITLDKADLYGVAANPASVQFSNLSNTSGDTTVPFTTLPTWDIQQLHLLPDGSGFLVEQDGVQPSIEHLSHAGVRTMLVNGVRRVQQTTMVGNRMLLAIQKAGGSRPVELHQIEFGATPQASLLQTGDSTLVYSNLAIRPDGWAAWSADDLVNPSRVQRLLVGGLAPMGDMSLGSQVVGDALDWTQAGNTVFTTGDGATTGALKLWILGQAAPADLGTLVGPLHLLPARS